jgi:hypothetical protein
MPTFEKVFMSPDGRIRRFGRRNFFVIHLVWSTTNGNRQINRQGRRAAIWFSLLLAGGAAIFPLCRSPNAIVRLARKDF